jgi:hypothetical protein
MLSVVALSDCLKPDFIQIHPLFVIWAECGCLRALSIYLPLGIWRKIEFDIRKIDIREENLSDLRLFLLF